MKFLLLILFSFNLYAEEQVCQEIVPSSLEDLIELKKNLNWHAATDKNVKQAACLRLNPFSVQEMKSWMREHDGSKKINTTVHGIKFENESEENIKAFKFLTTAVDFIDQPDPERQKKFKSDCKNVQCAVDQIFGKSVGTHLLFMQRKFGMNGSHLAYVNADPWKKSELDSLLLGLSDFPDKIFPVEDSKKMTHFSRGYMRKGGGMTIANATMEFFDRWNDQNSWQKRTTITHELAHVLAGVTQIDDSKEWMSLGNWEKTTKIKDGEKIETAVSQNPRAVSEYGKTNNWEDLAESVVAYRYNPQLLKSKSPAKYNLIKTVLFDNVEYTSNKACKNPKRLTDELREKAAAKIGQWNPSDAEIRQIATRCSDTAIQRLGFGEIDLSSKVFQECYENAVKTQTTAFMRQQLASHPYKKFIEPLFRNTEPLPVEPGKLKLIASKARNAHRTLLKKEITQGFKDNYFFSPKCTRENANYSYQKFNEKSLGIDAHKYQKSFSNLTLRSCYQIIATNSIRRMLGLGFSDSEIEAQVNSLIK